jgi:hypothetical protein
MATNALKIVAPIEAWRRIRIGTMLSLANDDQFFGQIDYHRIDVGSLWGESGAATRCGPSTTF